MKRILFCLLLAACGDNHIARDGGGDGGSHGDGGAAPDAADRCQVLCSCTEQFCADDMAACLTQCAGLQDSVIECRTEHCGYAQTNPTFHCPHALGDPTSPGVPPACIQQ